VVADVYDDGPDRKAPATVYWPAREHPFIAGNIAPVTVAFAIRSDRTGTDSLLHDIRQAVSAVAPDLPVSLVRTPTEVYDDSLGANFIFTGPPGIAGAMALLLGVVGIYGVLAYAVIERRREVGIRLALGARPHTVTKMFVCRGMAVSGIGLALGAAVAAGITRWMSSLLFGVRPVDPATFLAVAGVLVVAALAASYLPARRAAAVDPVQTLRGQ
jgi:putative ABC transport system permease protein